MWGLQRFEGLWKAKSGLFNGSSSIMSDILDEPWILFLSTTGTKWFGLFLFGLRKPIKRKDCTRSDSDEEEEDYQLIIKHDWAAITYLDVRSFHLWLPSTTEVRNRPVWVRWRHEIFAHYHDRRPSRLPHVHRQRSFTRVLQIHVLNIQITKFWLRCYWETFSWVFRWILQAGLYIIALYRKVASMCGDDTRVMIK